MVYNYQNITEEILSDLKPRTREVLVRRFGLRTGEKETLQTIGEDHGITRERIRQIEGGGLRQVKPQKEHFDPVFDFFGNQLQVAGGVREEDNYLSILGPSSQKNYIFFLLVLEDNFERFKESDLFYTLWTNNPSLLKAAQEAVDYLASNLEKEGRPVEDRELEKTLEIEPNFLFSILSVSKKISKGPQGLWGLSDWSTINPRGTKDRSYIVLKEVKKPLHFREIAQIINKGNIFPDKVNIHPQTVHNELIKHGEFVLVGRGTYALREWGYRPGTVEEVIAHILEKRGPMDREQLVKEVLKRRMVKKNTVLLNLRNEDQFVQDEKERYRLASQN